MRVRLWRVIEKHAHKTGPNTFKVLFKQPTLNYLYDMSETGGGNGGAVISKDYFEIDCDGYEYTYGHIFKKLHMI